MADILTPEQRRVCMSHVKSQNTSLEMKVRRGLHSYGMRYTLHDGNLAGKPDLVFSRHKVALFVHGCFWHRHGCYKSTLPATRQDFWLGKFEKNILRDQKNIALLTTSGWRVLIIWECALTGPHRQPFCLLLDDAARFILKQSASILELSGIPRTEKSFY